MARPNIKTVRAANHPLGTGDFTTLQSWADYAAARTNPYQWAECYGGSNLGTFTLSSWSSTPSSSGYARIYAASGEMHGGYFHRGPFITSSSESDVCTVAVSHTQIDGLGTTRGIHVNIDSASGVLVENCWAKVNNNTSFKFKTQNSSTASSGNVIRNCISIGSTENDIGFEVGGEDMINGSPNIGCYNCTAYGNKNTGFKIYNTKSPGFTGGANVTLKNCVSMDCTGADFSYILGGAGTLTSSNNLSSDTTAFEYGSNQLTGKTSITTFVNPDKGIGIDGPTIAGSGVSITASGDFRPKEFSYLINAGVSVASGIPYSFAHDIRGVKRDALYDIGAYEFIIDFRSSIPLFVAAPTPMNESINLVGYSEYIASGIAPLNTIGFSKINSSTTLMINAPIPVSSGIPLFIAMHQSTRESPLYLKVAEPDEIVGLSSFLASQPTSTGLALSQTASLYLDSQFTTSKIAISRRIADSGNTPRTDDHFKIDRELARTSFIGLTTLGFSGIRGPNSYKHQRVATINSDNFKPAHSRGVLLFSESEKNCLDGSLYKFDNNIKDESSDYQFTLYPSGWHRNIAGVGQILESGFYQTSTRFTGSSTTGSGTARFTGGVYAGIKMVSNTSYHGTVLMQSGSPSIHDQHRITPRDGHIDASGNFTSARRGAGVAFWFNNRVGLKANPGVNSIKGVMGNLLRNDFIRGAASGQWSIYYIPSIVKPSGDTPFNSLTSITELDGEGRFKVKRGSLGGLIPWVNTTAGGSMGKIFRTDSDNRLVLEHVPDTMLPVEEDRWYYLQFWIDTHQNKSFLRVASPAQGHPGQSGYRPEIKPITDTCQKWDGYEVKTDADNIKFKIGGDLERNQSFPYNNLGYGNSSKEEYLIDEVILSNKVCSRAAMEQQFDTNYYNYVKQFYENNTATLYISGKGAF